MVMGVLTIHDWSERLMFCNIRKLRWISDLVIKHSDLSSEILYLILQKINLIGGYGWKYVVLFSRIRYMYLLMYIYEQLQHIYNV